MIFRLIVTRIKAQPILNTMMMTGIIKKRPEMNDFDHNYDNDLTDEEYLFLMDDSDDKSDSSKKNKSNIGLYVVLFFLFLYMFIGFGMFG